ncbi:DUF6238 family protein [Streptomyces sp. NPDC051561]|uniref:DUF6238 family protein n=1 Tax=Streptomyces sp. NPDC051561 TaxID=3365658 RepID=UPI0037968EA6
MTPRNLTNAGHPFLRAATTGLHHHTRELASTQDVPADRAHADVLHSHLTASHRLLDQLAESTRLPHPAAGSHLATARTRLWQAATALHDAFHVLPPTATETADHSEQCRPERLPEGPPFLTICQRHVSSVHAIRRKTTPRDLDSRLHGHTTHCGR